MKLPIKYHTSSAQGYVTPNAVQWINFPYKIGAIVHRFPNFFMANLHLNSRWKNDDKSDKSEFEFYFPY